MTPVGSVTRMAMMSNTVGLIGPKGRILILVLILVVGTKGRHQEFLVHVNLNAKDLDGLEYAQTLP